MLLLARVTFMKHILSTPAMFFWGIGTSTLGYSSMGWTSTASAAALGVATIIIPGLDSFFSGRAGRSVWTWVSAVEWNGLSVICRYHIMMRQGRLAILGRSRWVLVLLLCYGAYGSSFDASTSSAC